MDAVEQHSYLEAILSPLSANEGVGENLEDDEALDFLESELMKLGSLHQQSIDWDGVEKESVRLLSEKGKDLKVLGHLLQALQHRPSATRYALSLRMLRGALESWWEQAWPWPGERGKRGRGKLFVQMIQRATAAAEKAKPARGEEQVKDYCRELVAAIETQAGALELPTDRLGDLSYALKQMPDAPQPASESATAESNATASSASSPSGSNATTASSAPSLDGLRLEAGNERGVRQTLLTVADFLCEQSPGEPLGYRVRRHAIWFPVTALPVTRDGIRTELAPVSADRVADYREAASQSPDLALWRRIEQSLSVSPFWLDGHYLSAEVAMRLGHGDCARAIAESLAGLLKRLPGLEKLTFNDGTPFVQPETLAWLAGQAENGASGPGESWDATYQAARERLENEGLTAGLGLLEEGLAGAKEPRERFYWRLLSADLLQEAGLAGLAKQYYSDLRGQTESVSLNHWEPALLARLDRNLEKA